MSAFQPFSILNFVISEAHKKHSYGQILKSSSIIGGAQGINYLIICIAHRKVNYQELADWAKCVVDTRNVMAGCRIMAGKVRKA